MAETGAVGSCSGKGCYSNADAGFPEPSAGADSGFIDRYRKTDEARRRFDLEIAKACASGKLGFFSCIGLMLTPID